MASDTLTYLKSLEIEELLEAEVTTVSKKSEKPSDATAAVIVITAGDIRRSGTRTIADALRMAPGIQVSRFDANTWVVSSPGFNDLFSNKLLVLMDGRGVYTPLFSGVFGDVQDTMIFDSEELVAWALGYRWQPEPRISIDAAAFYNQSDNLHMVEPDPAGSFLGTDPPPPHMVTPAFMENKMKSLFTAHLKSNRPDARHQTPRLFLLISAVLLAVTLCRPVQSEVNDPDQVKAVFLYNPTNLITWPAKADRNDATTSTIGVFGHDAPGIFLEHAVSGETTRGLPIAVKYFQSLDRIESDPCDLLLIDGDQMHLWLQIREVARRRKRLTVSDVESFGRRGGVVGLLTSGRKIRIEINLEEGRRNGFEISAKLLQLAHVVTVGKDD